LEKFILEYPGSIPVIIDLKAGEKLLSAESTDEIITNKGGRTAIQTR
jgi:hypothetical protein